MKKYIFILTLFFSASSVVKAQETGMAFIKEGSFVPLYGAVSKNPVAVKSFYIDIYPVTNRDFLAFIRKNPLYQKSRIKGIFADKSYLAYWPADFDFGNANPKSPVTNVSWFAAKKYCECEGKRLATMDEWEYVAMADTKKRDARTKKEFNEYIYPGTKNLKLMKMKQVKLSGIIGAFTTCTEWFGNGLLILIRFFCQENPEKTRVQIKISFAEAALLTPPI